MLRIKLTVSDNKLQSSKIIALRVENNLGTIFNHSMLSIVATGFCISRTRGLQQLLKTSVSPLITAMIMGDSLYWFMAVSSGVSLFALTVSRRGLWSSIPNS